LSIAEIASSMTSDNCNIALENDEIVVTSQSGYTARDRMTLTVPNVQFPAGDVTIFVEAQSIDPLEGMTLEDRVPRDFEVHISGLPNYGEGNFVNKFYEEIYGFMGTFRMEEMSFYYRRPGVAAGPQDIEISVQGRGSFKIKSIKIYNEADILIRSFDNGVSIANPSFDTKTIDMSTVFPGQLEDVVSVPSIDAHFIQVSGVGNSLNASSLDKSMAKIYPNPVSDYLQVELANSSLSHMSYKLYNMIGQLVLENTAEVNGGKFEIDLSGMTQGLHLLEIRTNESITHKKIIIN